MKKRKLLIILVAFAALLLAAGCGSIERKLLLFPSHRGPGPNESLTPWMYQGATIGFARVVADPKNIWLLFHGNAGQALDREYALPSFSPEDSVYVLEYPGYGQRAGTPTFKAFQTAAAEAYQALRASYPKAPICVVGESIGTGPACYLAAQYPPPEKIVLIVPFDNLASVAREHFPGWMVWALLSHRWDNVKSLQDYHGTLQIFAAAGDTIIPPDHARALAKAITGAKLTVIDGGHNDWSHAGRVEIRNP